LRVNKEYRAPEKIYNVFRKKGLTNIVDMLSGNCRIKITKQEVEVAEIPTERVICSRKHNTTNTWLPLSSGTYDKNLKVMKNNNVFYAQTQYLIIKTSQH